MKYLLILIAISLSGCENGSLVLTDKDRQEEQDVIKRRGDARLVLFKECMNLAAKMPRQADDDVSDIVDECSSQAYYMTNFIK